MPLRDLMYLGRAYEQLVPVRERYKSKKIKIPRPEFFVFYNGTEEMEAERILKLSDLYVDNASEIPISLELKVRVININSDVGNEVLKTCRILNEYTLFVESVRNFKAKGDEDYMKSAIRYCIEHHILEEYLSRKGSEVMGFLCAEYDYEMDMEVKGEEKFEDGKIEGKIECIIDLLEELGEVPKGIREKIKEQEDMEVLGEWFKIATKVQTIEEFIDKM